MMPVKGSNGKTAGATSLVIPISSLLNRRILFQNIPPQTRSFMCYLAVNPETDQMSARIFAREAHTDFTHRSWRGQLESEWLTGDDAEKQQAMLKDSKTGASNMMRMPYKGSDSLWIQRAVVAFCCR